MSEIIAYASSTRLNALLSAAQFNSALQKNRTEFDIPLVAAADLAAKDAALAKINDIRNSIIGFQKMNWSEHIYPLVAALNEAGIEGLHYPEARANVGTMLERTLAAEAAVEAKNAEIDFLVHDLKLIRDGYGPNHTSAYCKTISTGALRKAGVE